MGIPAIILLAVGLAMDCFAVALGLGTTEHIDRLRPALRLAWHFGLFQALMPVIGWLAGRSIEPLISEFDHWLAFGLLAFVGGRMIRSGLASGDEVVSTKDPSRGRTLVILSVATSIDALAVGFSLAAIGVDIALPTIIIGLTSLALTLVGLMLGRRLGQAFGKRMEMVGGIILILIGLRVLISHLFA